MPYYSQTRARPHVSADPRFQETQVFFAGAKRHGADIVVDGGRVLGVTSHGGDLDEAVARAYVRVQGISFERCDFRHDIGGVR